MFSSIIGSGLMYGLLESIEFFPSSLSFELFLISYGCLALLLLWFIYASGTKRCHDLGDQGIFQMVPLYVFWIAEHGVRPHHLASAPRAMGKA